MRGIEKKERSSSRKRRRFVNNIKNIWKEMEGLVNIPSRVQEEDKQQGPLS